MHINTYAIINRWLVSRITWFSFGKNYAQFLRATSGSHKTFDTVDTDYSIVAQPLIPNHSGLSLIPYLLVGIFKFTN